MDWIVKGLKDFGFPFKLIKSMVDAKRFDLYQVYALHNECAKTSIVYPSVPCVIVKMSYSRTSPLIVCFGVYNYAMDFVIMSVMRGRCAATATRYTWQNMMASGFGNTLKRWVSNYDSELKFIRCLDCIPIKDIADVLRDNMIPFYVRKKALGILEKRGLHLNELLRRKRRSIDF